MLPITSINILYFLFATEFYKTIAAKFNKIFK
jgi:hypothetical protein